MIRMPVTSSDIRSVGYDEELQVLEIEFHSGGIYQYFAVPGSVYAELMSASSHGSYFHRHIKASYEWQRIR
jgi:hypothetical protein